jgi:histidinol-phosphate aminotransferase
MKQDLPHSLPATQAHILAVQAYKPGKPIETLARESGLAVSDIIKLASNESPLGPSPQALKVCQQALLGLSRYPDGASFALLKMLAAQLQVDAGWLTLGNGSNEILNLLSSAYLKAGDQVWFDQHSFAIYPIVTQLAGAIGVSIPAKNYGHDLQAYLQKLSHEPAPKMIFLANPNNPTGTWFNEQTLCTLLDALPATTLVVLDEAYREYVQADGYPNGLTLLDRYPNVVVTRTFSKAYGLAGLRLGYAVAHPQITQILQRVRQPFNVNLLAQQAGIAALEDEAHLQKAVLMNREQLVLMVQQCQARGLAFIPSQANFLTIDCGSSALPFYEALLRHGIIVRPIADYGLLNHLRVSIGLPEENQRFWQKWDLLGNPA